MSAATQGSIQFILEHETKEFRNSKEMFETFICISHRIHGTIGIFTYMIFADFYGKSVGKYTVRPMDPSWVLLIHKSLAPPRLTQPKDHQKQA